MVENCYNFFKDEMKKPYIEEETDSSLIADHALISLTKIIQAYPDELKNPDVLKFWFERLPIWDASKICDVVYSFLADLLEEQNPAILNEENFERIIELVLENAFSAFMEDSTSIRFAALFQDMCQNPCYAELMQSAYCSLSNNKDKIVFNKLLSYQE